MLEFVMLAAACAPDVHATTLAAVVRHESRANPFAIGVNGKSVRLARQPKNLNEAIATVKDLKARGIDFDAGLGQINVRNWQWLGLTPETVFEPCTNLAAAQAVLSDCYTRASKRHGPGQKALQLAFSCYNTGNFTDGFSNGYVAKVLAQAGIKVPAIAVADSRAAASSTAQSQMTAEASLPSTGNDQRPRNERTQRGQADGFSSAGQPDGFTQSRQADAFASSPEGASDTQPSQQQQ